MIKRYVITVDFYGYAESDEQMIKEANQYVELENRESDCKMSVVSIHEQNFGEFGGRKVELLSPPEESYKKLISDIDKIEDTNHIL